MRSQVYREGERSSSLMIPLSATTDREAILTDGDDRTVDRSMERFAQTGDSEVFETIVQRYGPLVWGVCLRVMKNHHDAEDVFQATFLLLARKAASIRATDALPIWLHRVAYHESLRSMRRIASRKRKEIAMMEIPEPGTVEQNPWHEVEPVLDRELNNLPDKYRLPVLLCDIGGFTQKQAAQQIGCPEGTLATRLSRAHGLLASRLTRRGIVVTSATLGILLAQNVASAAVPATVISSTVAVVSTASISQAASSGTLLANLALPFKSAGSLLVCIPVTLTAVVGAVMLMANLGPQADRKGNAPAPNQKDVLSAIVDSYRAQQSAVKSIYIQYRTTASALGTPRELLRYLKMPYLPETTEVFATKDSMRYYSTSHANGGVYDDLTQRKPDGTAEKVNVAASGLWTTNGQAVYMLDGAQAWRKPALGSIELPTQLKDSDGSRFNQTYLTTVLRGLPDVFGIDKLRYRQSLIGLGERSLLKLRPNRETIDDAPCAVIDWVDDRRGPSGTDRLRHVIWCDPSLNYAVRQHKLLLDDGKTLIHKATMNDFTEVVDGVWFPKHIVSEQSAYPSENTKDVLGKPLMSTDLVVETIHANDIQDELFTPTIAPGTMVIDTRTTGEGQQQTYTQPEEGQQITDLRQMTIPVRPQPPAAQSQTVRNLILVNVVVLMLIGVVWLIRGR